MIERPANGARVPWATEPDELRQLTRVALGAQPADLVIGDGDLVNVYTGEVQERCSLAIKGRHIAYVGRDARHTIGAETEVLDAAGKVLIPGLIDGHTHIFNRHDVPEFVRHALPTGTTTVVTEMLELVFPLGSDVIPALLANLRAQPLRIFATLPALATLDPRWPGIDPSVEQYVRFLDDDLVLGLGESFWADALRDDGRLAALYAAAHSARKSLEGHSAGARDRNLQAYLATGQSSCHEPITQEAALALLRGGLHVLLRQGAIRGDLSGVAGIRDAGIDLRRMAVCSDTVEPADLLAGKYMNSIVEQAVGLGFDPVAAVQMASLNVAEHFHLDYWLGGLAAGKLGDLAIVPDLRRIAPEVVLIDGRVVAREGSTVAPAAVTYPDAYCHSVRLGRELRAADFRVSAPAEGLCTVRGIEQVTDLVTREARLELPARGGELLAEPERDIVKVAALERRKGEGETFVGFLTGHGLRRGAVATTMTWDSTAMIVVGVDEDDMALAANHLVRLQGGAVVCANGRVLAEFPAPIGGFLSQQPLAAIVAGLDDIQRAASQLGASRSRYLLSLETLTSAAIPHLRINHAGYHSLRDGRTRLVFG